MKRLLNKTKILGSSKLSKIVDTLKDKVMKIDYREKKSDDRESERSRHRNESKVSKSQKSDKSESKNVTERSAQDSKSEVKSEEKAAEDGEKS